MLLYEENYRQFRRFCPPRAPEVGAYAAETAGHPTLFMEILEHHRYTTVIRLTYHFGGGEDQGLDPDAYIRVYHDARLAEATYCRHGDVLRQLAGAWPPASDMVRQRWRMNLFLDKWLAYLLHEGYGFEQMRQVQRLPECCSDKTPDGERVKTASD